MVRIPGHGITTLSLLISRSSRLLSRPPNRDGFRRVLSLLFVLCGGTVPGPVSSTPERRDALLNTRAFRDLRVPPLSDTQSFRATPFEFQTGSIRKGETRKISSSYNRTGETRQSDPPNMPTANRSGGQETHPKRKSHPLDDPPGPWGWGFDTRRNHGRERQEKTKKKESTRGHKGITNHHSSGARDFGITASGIVARPGWPIYISTSRHEFDFLGPEWSGPIPFRVFLEVKERGGEAGRLIHHTDIYIITSTPVACVAIKFPPKGVSFDPARPLPVPSWKKGKIGSEGKRFPYIRSRPRCACEGGRGAICFFRCLLFALQGGTLRLTGLVAFPPR